MNHNSFSIIHLSDLHFGRIQEDVLHSLHNFIESHQEGLKLIIITGDLTQRAKKTEFLKAREFFGTLKCPIFLVPGNHDVPLYNLFLRIFSPYRKFIKYIGPWAQHTFEDADVAVFGTWTLNRFTVKDGHLTKKEAQEAKTFFENQSSEKIRILACHHPIAGIHQRSEIRLAKPHFIMSGHEHQSQITASGEKDIFPILMASGTSTSNRTRTEANSFNLINVASEKIKTEIWEFSQEQKDFVVKETKEFKINP